MGKIVASYLLKVHLHADDGVEDTTDIETPTNDAVKATIVDALHDETGLEATVSLVERTDD